MNGYTVARATKGLADYLHGEYPEKAGQGVVIAYDSRHRSREFALEAAHVLCAAGIPVKFFQELEPIPVLSFAVKYYGAQAGIVITASHNPKEYNGYKVYGPNGGQLVPEDADRLTAYVNAVTDLAHIARDGGEELLKWIGEETVNAFLEAAFRQSIYKGNPPALRIVYTPLHGSGRPLGNRILDCILTKPFQKGKTNRTAQNAKLVFLLGCTKAQANLWPNLQEFFGKNHEEQLVLAD